MSPKYKQLATILKEDIRSNWKPNEKYHSQRALISRYGVSFSTVERALGVLCDEGFLACAHGKGTFVRDHDVKRETGVNVYLPMRGSKSNIFNSYYSGGIFNGMERFLLTVDASLMLLSLDDFEEAGDRSLFKGRSGVIFVFFRDAQRDTVEALRKSGVPMVVIGNYMSDTAMPLIDGDNEGGVRLMVDYLIKKGHRRIGYVYSEMDTVHEADRLRAFKNAMTEFGLPVVPEWQLAVGCSVLADDKKSDLNRIFKDENRPTALAFSSFYPVAMPLMSELRRMGLRLPGDVSIIGFDDPEWAMHSDPPLTIIKQPLEEIGWHAAQKLVSLIKGEVVVQREILPMKVVERASVVVCR
ncbi:MAG: GntR family transcriptional regulator [bacterium]|nr:GntR family transcriptional regulator [bacterium]